MVLLSRSIVSKDSNPVAERVSSTIRELLWRTTAAEEPQASLRQSDSRSGARQSSTAHVKQTKKAIHLATFSGVLNQERWSLWRWQPAYPNEFCGRWTPQSSRPVIPVSPARRIRVPVSAAAVFVHAVHAELSSSTSIPRTRHVGRYDYVPKIKFRTSSKIQSWAQSSSKMINDELNRLSARRHNFYL